MRSTRFGAVAVPHVSQPARRASDAGWRCAHAHGRIVADRLVPAFDSHTRRTVLLKPPRSTTGGDDHRPTSAVHTWFMKFDIDIAFVGARPVLKARYRAAGG